MKSSPHQSIKRLLNQNLRYPPVFYILAGSLSLIAAAFLLEIHIISGFLLIALLLYFLYSKDLIKKDRKQTYLSLAFLFVIFVFTAKNIVHFNKPVTYIPVTGLVMFVTILYNNLALSFSFCVLASLCAGIISGGSLYLSLIFFITAIVAVILVFRRRSRTRILGAGLCAGIAQMFLYWVIYRQSAFDHLAPNLFNGFICAVVAAGTFPFLENLFGVVTDISLLELSDFNHPLLKRMILEAPGTYHHSLIVGNLAEAAAEQVGANPLLARTGAYYHDIGKLAQPEYFMENQRISSKHTHLSPSISKMVIMSHVKEGLAFARKYRLKPAIVDFITQHHGTSLVYYFYRKALEEIEQDEKIHEEGFRYPGPQPTSKETAIVLLADSVEAATRACGLPSPARIEEVVHKVINNKFIDGQLNNCELTLKDLERIAKVFIHLLSGIYHGRIEYLEISRSQLHHKKRDHETASSEPRQDKIHHSESL
jgi:putative nucleotidyltransferase with HDIG domain